MTPTWQTFVQRGFGQIRRYGIGLLFQRYVRRYQILRSTPLSCPADSTLEVHMQVCRRDWINGIWTLKSLAHFGGQPFRLVLLEDGSLTEEQRGRYRAHFPGFIEAMGEDMATRVERDLRLRAPHMADLRKSGIYFTLPKVIDSWLLAKNETILCVDPDVLFFRPPTELHEAARPGQLSTFALLNHRPRVTHRDGSYCLDLDRLRQDWQIEFPPGFIIGLGAVQMRELDWEYVNAVFRSQEIPFHLRFMADQTVMALAAVRGGCQFLDASRYAVDPVPSLLGVVARHYFSKTRDLFYVEGLPALRRAGLLRSRS